MKDIFLKIYPFLFGLFSYFAVTTVLTFFNINTGMVRLIVLIFILIIFGFFHNRIEKAIKK